MKTIEKSEMTRENNLNVALKLFSRNGYLGATTKEISREARIAEVTLFRLFSTKVKLFEEVINRKLLLPTLRDLLPEITEIPYEEALQLIVESFLDTLTTLKDWIRIVQTEVQREPEGLCRTYYEFIDEQIQCFVACFRELQVRWSLRAFEPELGARAFHGMLFSHFYLEEIMLCRNLEKTDRDKVIREIVRIFAHGTLKIPLPVPDQ